MFLALLTAAAVAVFLLVTLGAVVRVTDSGLGCPDWPLCHGRLIPPLEFHTLIEYSHRLVASLTTTLVVLAAAVAWWRYRRFPHITAPLILAASLVFVAAILGGIAVLLELPPTVVTLHLATAELIFGLLLATLVWAWRTRRPQLSLADPRVRRWAAAAALATLVVIISGSYIVGGGAGTACPKWPLCDGGLLPSYSEAWLHMAHRLIAAFGALLAVWAAWTAWRGGNHSTSIGWAGAVAGGVVVAQMVVGAANPWTGFSTVARVAHLSLATAMWGSFVVLGALSWQPAAGTVAEGRSAIRALLADYVALTKPRIILLLLVTALGGMFLAAHGTPPLSTVILFAIVFFWTPPHFWALALLLRDDYARAEVPMLPVVVGIPETTRSILLHSMILVSITILFFTVQAVGWLYLGGAVLLGAYFLFRAWRLFRTQAIRDARHLYLYSLLYLTLLFALVIVESVVTPWPR